MSVEQSRVLVVLGMHRSGTSALTRGLQTLGVTLGDNLMPAFEGNNNKGFWEDLEVVRINDSLLQLCSMDWCSLGTLSEMDWSAAAAGPLGQQAAAYLQQQLGRYPRFGLKDPRMPRLLPFWKLVLEQIRTRPAFIIANRNPLSVANSLSRRDSLPDTRSYLLWLEHSLLALRESEGYQRVVVSYDRLLEEPLPQLERIRQACGLPEVDPLLLTEYVHDFLDKSLRHDVVSEADALRAVDPVDEMVRETQELLELLASDACLFDDAVVRKQLDTLYARVAKRTPIRILLTDQDAEIVRYKRQLAETEEARLHAEVLRQRLAEEHQQLVEHRDVLREALLQTQTSLAEVMQSSSWRITAPLRALSRLRGVSRPVFRRVVSRIYYMLPERARARVLNVAFKRLGWLFRGMAPYEQWQRQQLLLSGRDSRLAHSSLTYRDGRYQTLQRLPANYCYLPPRRTVAVEQELASFARKPLISIVTPVYGVDPLYLQRLLDSVRQQWYPHWELILVEDAGPDQRTRDYLRSLDDSRLQVRLLERNVGIAAATNIGLEMSRGDYIAFLDHDDELTQDALFEIVVAINTHDPDFIYSDEDKIDAEGNFSDPFFKPGWSPDALMSIMYTCHLSCIRTPLLRQLGGLRSEFDGAQDYDLALRVSELTGCIHHIPKVLYHWRVLPSSIASGINAKPYASDAVRCLKEQALKRRGLSGVVEPVASMPGQYRIRYHPQGWPLVSIIVPSRDNAAVLQRCVESLFANTSYDNYELVLVDNQSVDPATLTYFDELVRHPRVRLLRYPHPFNYSAINNLAVSEARGQVLLFLNDDTEVLASDWLERLLGYAQLSHVGAVGAQLLFPSAERIQHCGVVNLADGPGHAFYHARASTPLYFGRNVLEWNWLAVTGACLMVERDKFDAVGGFDETFPVAYNDVDLCFALHKAGWHNVVCNAVQLLHHESLSRGQDQESPAKRERLAGERRRLFRKHPHLFMLDPYHHPNLHPNSVDFLVQNY